MSITDYTGPAGEGLAITMGNIMQTAREQRAIHSPQNQLEEAVSKDAMEKFKKDQEKVPVEDILKSNRLAKHMMSAAKDSGILVGDEKELSRGQIKEGFKQLASNPRVFASIIEKSYNENYTQDQQYKVAIAEEEKKLPDLMENPIGNKDKIAKIQETLAKLKKEQAPFSKGRLEDSQHMDRMKSVIEQEDYDKMTDAHKTIYRSLKEEGNAHPSAQQVLDREAQIKEKDVTGEMKNFEAEKSGMSSKRGTPEYGTAFSEWRKKQQEQKTSSYVKGRMYPVFDLTSGKTKRKSGDWINHNEGATLDPNDADVVALKEHQKYSTGISRFVNRIDTLGDTIMKTMQTRGLSQGSKLKNYTVQQLIQKGVLGSGDIQALNQQMKGLGAEIGKVESGSVGISGATVSAIESFNVDLNMPADEFVKYLQGGKAAARSVTDAMNRTKQQTIQRIYSGTGHEIPGYLTQQGQESALPSAPETGGGGETGEIKGAHGSY